MESVDKKYVRIKVLRSVLCVSALKHGVVQTGRVPESEIN